MKKLFMLFLILCTANVFAAFDDMEFGTRGQSLGPGFTALADDASAVYYNPAGMTALKENEALVSASKLYMGLGDGNSADTDNDLYSLSLGYARDFQFLHAGAGYYRLGLSSYYSENVFFLAVAKDIKQIGTSFGLSAKLLNSTYGSDAYTAVNTVFKNGSSTWGFGLDLGALARISSFSIGLSVQNLYTSGLGLKDKEILPICVTAAVAWIMPDTMRLLGSTGLSPVLGFQYKDNDYHFGLGAEIWFFTNRQLGLRFNVQAGNDSYSEVGFGLSYNRSLSGKADIRFSYGFDYPLGGIKGTYGTHHLDVGFGI